jgi:hypothetical protein
VSADGAGEEPETRYNCIDKKCVIDNKGPYKTNTCDNKCEKSDATPPSDNKNEIGVVCEVQQTAKTIREAVSVELIGKIKDTKGCKNFS